MQCLQSPQQTSSSAACAQPRSACLPGWPAAATATGPAPCASPALHHTTHSLSLCQLVSVGVMVIMLHVAGCFCIGQCMFCFKPIFICSVRKLLLVLASRKALCTAECSHRGCLAAPTGARNEWRHDQVSGQHLLRIKSGGLGSWSQQLPPRAATLVCQFKCSLIG